MSFAAIPTAFPTRQVLRPIIFPYSTQQPPLRVSSVRNPTTIYHPDPHLNPSCALLVQRKNDKKAAHTQTHLSALNSFLLVAEVGEAPSHPPA